MTYYGRWTYKYEIGAKKKAAAVLIVHETGPAGYPFAVVQGKTGEQFTFVSARQEHGPRGHRGLDHARPGEGAVRARRPGLRRLKAQAATRAFKPVRARRDRVDDDPQHAAPRRLAERRRPGSKAATRGRRTSTSSTPRTGITSASASRSTATRSTTAPRTTPPGTAALLEIARAFTRLPKPPRRSILFLAVTAEEQGLLGSRVLRRAAALSAGEDARRHQHGRAERQRPDEGSRRSSGSARRSWTTTRGPRRRSRAASLHAGRRAGEGLLLPLRPLQVRQGRRAGAQHRRGRRVRRQAGVVRHRGARALHRRIATTSRRTR